MKTKKRKKENWQVKKHKEDNENIFIIFDNDLSRLMMLKVTWLAKVLSDEEDGKKVQKTKQVQFYWQLFSFMIEIDKKMRDLQLCINFISSNSTSSVINKRISKSEYITYHLEYYYINIVAIYDRLLHLVNFTYNLGLHDRFVSKDIIIKNNNVNKKVKKVLKMIDKAIQGVRALQNKIKHKEGLRERDQNKWLEKAEILEQAGKISSGKEQKQFTSLAKKCYSFYIKEKKKELVDSNRSLLKALNIFYNALMPEIDKRITRFK